MRALELGWTVLPGCPSVQLSIRSPIPVTLALCQPCDDDGARGRLPPVCRVTLTESSFPFIQGWGATSQSQEEEAEVLSIPAGPQGWAEATFRPCCCPAGLALGQEVLPTEDLDLLQDDRRVGLFPPTPKVDGHRPM